LWSSQPSAEQVSSIFFQVERDEVNLSYPLKQDRILSLKTMPGLKQHIVSMDIATPVTMHRYTLNDLGASVGWSYTSTQQWKQKVPFIDGLYLAGHWVGPSGIYNVASSGKNAAELILRNKPG
jgi:phytoene dehydrogenase-like protein